MVPMLFVEFGLDNAGIMLPEIRVSGTAATTNASEDDTAYDDAWTVMIALTGNAGQCLFCTDVECVCDECCLKCNKGKENEK
jgi:hypothetical protein